MVTGQDHHHGLFDEETERQVRPPLFPSPKADGALFIFLGLIGLLVLACIIGKRVAHFLRRSQVRFYRAYRHQ
jgi:hypothetical protein